MGYYLPLSRYFCLIRILNGNSLTHTVSLSLYNVINYLFPFCNARILNTGGTFLKAHFLKPYYAYYGYACIICSTFNISSYFYGKKCIFPARASFSLWTPPHPPQSYFRLINFASFRVFSPLLSVLFCLNS